MTASFYSAETLDDVMRWVIDQILRTGNDICPTKGPAKEITGVVLEITNPLSRISRTETKGTPFSCLGELCWYLSGCNDIDSIAYYLPKYRRYAEGQKVFGGYGPRFFNWNGFNQFANVTDILASRMDTRKAVIQLFDAKDLAKQHKDVPCTCSIQFMVRQQKLHMFTFMRSNDAYIGLPHDIFCFTMLQEIMAKTLSCEIGRYKHMVGSLHLYSQDTNLAQQFLDEGWQSTQSFMQPMPTGDPWPAIEFLLSAERMIRTGQGFNLKTLGSVDSYWADLVRLLLIYRSAKDGDSSLVHKLRSQMVSECYDPFIIQRITSAQTTP